ncbi:uncharacterized protein LOC143431789 [Xylocopa sonorina]|uniref:uncharacterized protein LOC143431789 n=1 Tax=Xylocopa sonorina TaxID=1818115 RepID=UPI00403AC33E
MATRKNAVAAVNTGLGTEHANVVESNRFAIRVPPFYPEHPILWFNQLEAQFALNGVVADHTKFYYVAAQLETKYAMEVQDIISNLPESEKYETLKAMLTQRLSPTQNQRIQQILGKEEMGDRTPSQFLRHMRNLAGTTVTDDFLRTLVWRPESRNYRERDLEIGGAAITGTGRDQEAHGEADLHLQTRSAALIRRKRAGIPLSAAISEGPQTSRFYVAEVSKEEFLIDTGSDLCAYPRARVKDRVEKTSAANSSVISTYGVRTFNLDLGLRRASAWKFIVADVTRQIIGADFLTHYGLLVDLRNRRLLDQTTSLSAGGRVIVDNTQSVKTIIESSPYDLLLAEYATITRPTAVTPQVFAPLQQYGVVINPTKCVFAATEVEFLGYMVNSQGTKPLPDKVEAIIKFLKPTIVKQLRGFLGMVNFYRRFIPNAAVLQAALNKLLTGKKLKSTTPITWTKETESALENLKTALAKATLLAHPANNAQKPEKSTPRQFRYLDYITQFSTDICHISGKDNEVADVLSRIEAISTPIDFDKLAESQNTDQELKDLIASGTSLKLKRIKLTSSDAHVYAIARGFPIENIEAETVARTFIAGWVARFGTPLRITTDQGRQFESELFKRLNAFLGSTHLRITAYHPAATGLVQRLHRQLKAAIRCHNDERWTDSLPIVLLGIRSAYRDDLKVSTAELVYGQNLRLLGEFFNNIKTDNREPPDTIKELRAYFRDIRPIPGTRHGQQKMFIHKDLETSSHVFVRVDAVKRPLQHPYEGPFPVVSRSNKTYIIRLRGKDTTVSVDHLKPAYSIRIETERNVTEQTSELCIKIEDKESLQPTCTQEPLGTRSGRRVRFPDRLQVGR